LGPWSAWLHDPDLGRALWEATKGTTRFRHLPEMIRQIVILVVGSKFGAAYEIYAHGAVALSSGMSSHRLATIVANLRPADLANEEGVAYDIGERAVRRRRSITGNLRKRLGRVRQGGNS
jgi:4-carboxymuconolactone decarboxylase